MVAPTPDVTVVTEDEVGGATAASGLVDEPDRVIHQAPAAAATSNETANTTVTGLFHHGRFRLCLPRMSSTLAEIAYPTADRVVGAPNPVTGVHILQGSGEYVTDVYDVAVIGSGMAGFSAAVQAARLGWRTVVIGEVVTGGQILNTALIENYPGFGAGVSGIDLVTAVQEQAAADGVEFAFGPVQGLTMVRPFHLLGDGGGWQARAVVVATGGTRRPLDVPGHAELIGRGVSECATCDGPFFRDQDVAVIGGGDSAMDEALVLATMCRTVHLITHGDDLTGLQVLRDRVAACPDITVTKRAEVDAIVGDGRVTAVHLTGGRELAVSGVFVHIGSDPATGPFIGIIPADAAGHLKVDLRMRTEVPGVFAAGECRWHSSRQLAAVAGDGVTAAIAADEWLRADSPRTVAPMPEASTVWVGQTSPARSSVHLSSPVVEADDLLAAIETAHARGWTDGLPIVPPTPDRVIAFLDDIGAEPDEVLGRVQSRQQDDHHGKGRHNAVMAGCLPEHLPVVVALVRLTLRAACRRECRRAAGRNVFIVNGPIRERAVDELPGRRVRTGQPSERQHRPGDRPDVTATTFGSVGGAGNDVLSPGPGAGPVDARATRPVHHVPPGRERGGLSLAPTTPRHARLRRRATASSPGCRCTGTPSSASTRRRAPSRCWTRSTTTSCARDCLCGRGSIVLVFPPELASHLVDSGFTKADVGRYVFEGTTRSKKWMKENGPADLVAGEPAPPAGRGRRRGQDVRRRRHARGRALGRGRGPAGGFCPRSSTHFPGWASASRRSPSRSTDPRADTPSQGGTMTISMHRSGCSIPSSLASVERGGPGAPVDARRQGGRAVFATPS